MQQIIILKIDGMTCNTCVQSVTRVLKETTGVLNAQVNLTSATVQFDNAQIDIATLIGVIEDAGFDASVL